MSMKFTHLRPHWTTDEAACVLEFIDELRDMLWASYGDQIIEMHIQQECAPSSPYDEQDFTHDLNDDIPF